MKVEEVIHGWNEKDLRKKLAAKQDALPGRPEAAWGNHLTPEELAAVLGSVEPLPPDKWYCFTAETPVQVPGGTMPIWALKAGDRVLTFDAMAGRVREARVAGLDVHEVTTPLLTLETSGERIAVTPGHRFHDADGWQAVEALGGRCLDLREKRRPVSLVGAERAAETRVYNVRVEEHRSYFVGQAGLWVRDN